MTNNSKIFSENLLFLKYKPITRQLIVAVSGFLLVFLSLSAQALQIKRGPYLQSGTSSSMIVKWRTDLNSNGVVRYGTDPVALDSIAEQVTLVKDHEVELNGLLPDTKYFYSVGSDSEIVAGGDSSHFFNTSPQMGTSKSSRIWVLGDSGTANSSARSVRDAYKTYTGTRDTDLVLMLGDNAYDDGTDSEYQRAVFDMYPEVLRNTVLWSTLGNHDGHSTNSSNQTGPYYDIFSFPRNGEAGGVPSGTEAYYSFDYGDIHFIILESYQTDRSANGAMMTWLAADAAATDKNWLVAFWHHPPYTKGSHNSDTEGQLIDMRENALPILEANGVDLVLTGHSHSYERSFLIDGHYGKSGTFDASMLVDGGDGRESGDGLYQKPTGLVANEGAVYIVAGSSGKVSSASLNHPAMFISMSRLGSVVMDVEQNRMDVLFLDSNGTTRDNFTLFKDELGNLPPVVDAGVNQTVDIGSNVVLSGSGSDPDGVIATYQWSQVSGPAVDLFNANTATAEFLAPDVTEDTEFIFKLTVTDNLGLSARDRIKVTVVVPGANLAPTVDAGSDINTSTNTTTSLSGIVTDDGKPVPGVLSVNWSQVSGPGTVAFSDATVASSSAVFPEAGTYVLRLSANDGELSSSDEVQVQVSVNTGEGADLTIDSLTYTVENGALVRAGKRLSLATMVSNSGTETAQENTLKWVLSTDPEIDMGDLHLSGLRKVRELASGDSRLMKGLYRIPATVVPGTYYLGAIVDTQNDVAESNEANNTIAVQININPKWEAPANNGGDDDDDD